MNTEIFLNSGNLEFIEQQYERFLADPGSVEPEWRTYFEREVQPVDPGGPRGPTVRARSIFNPAGTSTGGAAPGGRPASHEPTVTGLTLNGAAARSPGAPIADETLKLIVRQARVYQLVNSYRVRGHMLADLDPLDMRPAMHHPELELSFYGFSEADLDTLFPSGGFYGPAVMTLRELMDALKETYCRQIGAEFMNIQDPIQKAWLLEKMETTRNRRPLTREEQIRILEKLTAAEGLETFLHTKYVGTKRFSLEGAESLIPMIDQLIDLAAEYGVDEIVMGMSHRGRLNVLTNNLGQEPSKLFSQFEDIDPMATLGSGDVKYHLGFSADQYTRHGKKVHLSLSPNPSHLEAVDPVVEGRTRAKQDRRGDTERATTMPLLIHGDAAFMGQGLVGETLNLAGLSGYRTGGTIHIIINNQIGFTTLPTSSRSTPYPTDVAKMTQVPIFHVNGEDPESVAQVVQLAIEFRQTFKKDVVIDMFCFRKYGHNEGDEPNYTQPLMYRAIDKHPSVHTIVTRQMLKTGTISQYELDSIVQREKARLEAELDRIRAAPERARMSSMEGLWSRYQGGPDAQVPQVDTGVPVGELGAITERMTVLPEGFTPHRKAERILKQRLSMGRGETPLDWGMAEALAFGSLLWEGVPVRLSGQDSRRGTFSHRHAVLTDIMTGYEYLPLASLREGQGRFQVLDSSLSEAGVLGFDYGYSLDSPDALVMWEAQFGDFANGAQVIIDQFIASSEDKWGRLSGIVLLLPHGFEGQGPEHSSARLERYLQLCAKDNMQVCYPTTPAQIFHLLRRQVVRPLRKPLIVMTPKSLLRLPAATSPLSDLTEGRFQRVIPETGPVDAGNVKRLILCSGKFYFDLIEERKKRGIQDMPIARVEQLYPVPHPELYEQFAAYPNLKEICWVQEEPRNSGGWEFMRSRLSAMLGDRYQIDGYSRQEGASPATGSPKAHQIESQMLMNDIFGR